MMSGGRRTFLPGQVAKRLPVTLADLVARRGVALAALVRDLDRTHHRRQRAGALPVPLVGDAVEQAGAVGVAATGRIDDGIRFDAGDFNALSMGVDARTFGTERDDQRLDASSEFFERFPGAIAEQLGFVVVQAGVVGQLQEFQQLVAREHRQLLARIENEGHAVGGEVARMFQHAVAAVRRDDRQRGAHGVGHRVVVREIHCARVEGSDLVVVEVGRDEGLRGEIAGNDAHVLARKSQFIEATHVRAGIVADRRHDQRIAAEEFQVVGDIPRAAAKDAPDIGNQEADVQDVNLVRQDAVLETVLKDHDVVVGNGTADERGHGR